MWVLGIIFRLFKDKDNGKRSEEYKKKWDEDKEKYGFTFWTEKECE